MIKVIAGAVVAAAVLFGPAVSAHADGSEEGIESAVHTLYQDVQARCTPTLTPHFTGIEWTGVHTGNVGQGRIKDANPQLGGPFDYMWGLGPQGPSGYRVVPDPGGNGYWFINLQFC